MKIYTTEEFMKHSKSMHISICGRVGAEPSHTHDFIEIVYVLSGQMTQVINGKEYKVGHGDLLFMNYGCTHEFYSETDYSYVNILFSPELMTEEVSSPSSVFSLLSLTAFNEMRNDSDFGLISFVGNERKEIEDIILAMTKEYSEKKRSWETVMGNYFNTLIIKMLRKTELGIEQTEINKMWQELSDYIDMNIGEKLTLSSLASKCFYNPSYFSRIFKEKFGVPFMEYISRKRVELSVRLLNDTDLSIDEICERSGFADRSSFYHAFSRYIGTTPSKYRSNTRNVKKSNI